MIRLLIVLSQTKNWLFISLKFKVEDVFILATAVSCLPVTHH